jgi:hypothetical protein
MRSKELTGTAAVQLRRVSFHLKDEIISTITYTCSLFVRKIMKSVKPIHYFRCDNAVLDGTELVVPELEDVNGSISIQ